MLNNKKGKMNMFLVVGAVIVGLFVFGGLSLDSFTGTADAPDTSVDDAQAVSCSGSDPSLDANAVNFYEKGTSVTNTWRAFVNGEEIADTSSPFTGMGAGDSVLLLGSSANYYDQPVMVDAAVCGPDNVRADMIAEGALTSTFFNEDDQASTAAPIAADEVVTVEVKLRAAANANFGHPDAEGLIIGFDYNTTQIDAVTVVGADLVSVPRQSVGTDEEAWQISQSTLGDSESIRLTLTIEAASGVDPTSDITMTVYDGAAFINDAGELTYGVEDDDKTDLAQTNEAVTLDLS